MGQSRGLPSRLEWVTRHPACSKSSALPPHNVKEPLVSARRLSTILRDMKHHVWSKPDLQWEGFQPVAYWFGTEKIWALPLTRKHGDSKGDEPTTVGDIIVLLRDKQLKPESFERGVLESEFVAADDSLKVTVKGPPFNCDLLRIILQLHSEGIGALEAVWYYFDHDSCRQEPHEMYSFFVVAKNKIVRERVGFSDYLDSGFDPTIFETHDYKDMIWGR